MAVKVAACLFCSCQMMALLLFQLYTSEPELDGDTPGPPGHTSRGGYPVFPSRGMDVGVRRRVHSLGEAELGSVWQDAAPVVAATEVEPREDTQLDRPPQQAPTESGTPRKTGSPELDSLVFKINEPDLCAAGEEEDGVEAPTLLLQVHSHMSHKPFRDAIRDTWGRISRDYDRRQQVRLVFLLGEGDDRTADDFTDKVRHESRIYRDIVVAGFTDTYRNLTRKSLAGLVWAQRHCANSRYFFKTDDDVYFNVSSLLSLLEHVDVGGNILGALNNNATVMRSGLWAVSREAFPEAVYPPYCAGNSYVMRLRTVAHLLSAVPKARMLPIEDVYVTGVLAQETGRTCVGHPGFPHWYVGPSPKHVCSLLANRLFGVHNVQYEQMYKIFQKVQYGSVCDLRDKYKSLYRNKR